MTRVRVKAVIAWVTLKECMYIKNCGERIWYNNVIIGAYPI